MSIYRRKDSDSKIWHINFRTPDGKRIRQSTGTENKREAQELHDKLKAQYWREQKLSEEFPIEPERYTWEKAVVRWINESAHKRTLKNDVAIFRYLHEKFHALHLDEISKELIDSVRSDKKGTGVANGTVNRILALIRAVLKRAVEEWEWLEKSPHVRLLKEPTRRIRWLTHEEAQKVLNELPIHLSDMMIFTLSTGLRESNVTQLQWSQIDMQNHRAWIYADQAKSDKPIGVPLNNDAMAVIRRQIGKNETFVFTYKGNSVTRANNHAWRKALKRAGIDDFRWHDLRHTWASWHVQNGTPLHALQELGGWNSAEMVRRYAHLSQQHLAGYANNVGMVTNWSQAQKSPADENRRRA